MAKIEDGPTPTVEGPTTILGINDMLKGDAVRQIDAAIMACIADIANLTKSATQPRKVTAEITFKPGTERTTVAMFVEVKMKLAGMAGAAATIHVGVNQGALFATEVEPEQRELSIEEMMRGIAAKNGPGELLLTSPNGDAVAVHIDGMGRVLAVASHIDSNGRVVVKGTHGVTQ